jgi:hypothetical protein
MFHVNLHLYIYKDYQSNQTDQQTIIITKRKEKERQKVIVSMEERERDQKMMLCALDIDWIDTLIG